MTPKSRENIITIKEFLEDIYMYLNNNIAQSSEYGEEEEEQSQRHEAKRKELIESCKRVRTIFEKEFHPHDDTDSSSYLDMNGTNKNRIKCTTSDENKIEPFREDYVEMMKRKSGTSVIYNIYEATISLNSDYETCPFTGLPAVHLKLMCSPIAGLLTRLERKIFFIQSKDYYAGILDKWILLYPSKSNDMKPSEYFYPKSIGISKSENQFTIVTNGSKRYHFQAPNSHEFNEWVTNIKRIIEEVESGKEKELQVPQFLSRKLPSPPSDKRENNVENYYSYGCTPQSINSNDERLYEEPCSNNDQIEEVKEEEEEENMEEKPPELPLKTGKKFINDEYHSYDTPKPIKVLENVRENSPESQQDYDIPRMKVSEMTAILSNINLVSPEEKRKSSNVMKAKRAEEVTELVESPKKESKSPVRKWFKKRIMREKKISHREKSPMLVEETEGESEEALASVKGSKVNMIINQLEKTGQLKTLSKGLKPKKSLMIDNEEYETVCVKH